MVDKDKIATLLPIGSVVMLQDAQKALMIYGVCQNEKESNTEYDYIGVLYPEGNIGADTQFLFNHKDIAKVLFTGYETPERERFILQLQAFYTEQES